ncbi:glycoprotein K [Macropodid alphaherpesvirus 1]|uniref:Envelope glycoprotein K n=1 Tax=Macropodid alphaherpesvirus 1 TaxID=137443 RepID=A0A109ZVE8_9ALPH|nr:glycoprotein K [Macropodid alphaherpesvirus 1]AMB17035.1 glycoprotein K [Macropodid alphaherpesvirus 1]
MFLSTSIYSGVILGLITLYGLTLIGFIVFNPNPRAHCIYAVTPAGHNQTELIWMSANSSIIMLGGPSPRPQVTDTVRACYTDLIFETTLSIQRPPPTTNHRIVRVRKIVNCLQSLWTTEMRLITAAWVAYLAFIVLHRRRRMFGIVIPAYKMVPTTPYLLNYASDLMATIVLKLPYNRMARLLGELSVSRQRQVRVFEHDPITFLYCHPAVGIAIGCELLCKLTAHGFIIATAIITLGNCTITYPMILTIAIWLFVGSITIFELYISLRTPSGPRPPTPTGQQASTGVLAGGICGQCCSIFLSVIAMRLLYIFIIVVAVITALKYEQTIQQHLLDPITAS